MIKSLFAPLCLLFLSACTNDMNISARPIQIDIGRTADPSPVQILPVNFRVVTTDNLESFLSELRTEQGGTPVFIAITSRDYENLLINLADLRRYIEQQQAVIVYYRQLTTNTQPSQQDSN